MKGELLSSRSRVRVAVGAKLSLRMPTRFLPLGSQTTGPLVAGREQASLATGETRHYMTDPAAWRGSGEQRVRRTQMPAP